MNNSRATLKTNVDYVPVIDFHTVTFFDTKAERQVILIYALGQDGIIREFTGADWKSFPVQTT